MSRDVQGMNNARVPCELSSKSQSNSLYVRVFGNSMRRLTVNLTMTRTSGAALNSIQVSHQAQPVTDGPA